MKFNKNFIYISIISIGYLLTIVGCLLLFFGLLGFFDIERFSYGLSSGARIIASLAIAGCLLSAAGHFIYDSEYPQS
jgi:hypothetical protein